MSDREYPDWICYDCGSKHGRTSEGHLATWHIGDCGWCGANKAVTQPRDYGYPEWKEQ